MNRDFLLLHDDEKIQLLGDVGGFPHFGDFQYALHAFHERIVQSFLEYFDLLGSFLCLLHEL